MSQKQLRGSGRAAASVVFWSAVLCAAGGDAFVVTEDFCSVGNFPNATPFPDGEGDATEITSGPGVDASGNVAVTVSGFRGEPGLETWFMGIYVGDRAVATWDDTNPSTGQKFAGSLFFPVIVDGRVYFFGTDPNTNTNGNYRAPAAGDGPASVVVDNHTAVDQLSCGPCRCDLDGSGLISASDALLMLRRAVGIEFELKCPPC